MARKRWQKRVSAPVFVRSGEARVTAVADDRVPCPADFSGRLRKVSWIDNNGQSRQHLDDGSFWYLGVNDCFHLSLGIPAGASVHLVWGEPAYGASHAS